MNQPETPETCTRHFYKLMGSQRKELADEWLAHSRSLIADYNFTPDELKAFMTWAATENTHELDGMNSVKYLASANDPMASLVRNAPKLHQVWLGKKRAAAAPAKTKKSRYGDASNPLPYDVARWMFLGPGVNTPIDGWTSPRQKMDSIKICWYGVDDYMNYSDPFSAEEMDEFFAHSQCRKGVNNWNCHVWPCKETFGSEEARDAHEKTHKEK